MASPMRRLRSPRGQRRSTVQKASGAHTTGLHCVAHRTMQSHPCARRNAPDHNDCSSLVSMHTNVFGKLHSGVSMWDC
eukprot:COSAG06_NODE_1266_length_10061_cov_8.409958_2_plen_78_part_00